MSMESIITEIKELLVELINAIRSINVSDNGSVVGHENLKIMFPNFADDVAENGIDLRVGELYIINKDESQKDGGIGCVNDNKMPPSYEKVNVDGEDHYVLEPQKFYFAKIDREIHIPKGHIQQYYLRSTFSRCGLFLTDAIGDSDFNGTLMLGLYNASPMPISMGFNERIIQAVTIRTDGTETSYGGSYQNDKIYMMKKGNLGK